MELPFPLDRTLAEAISREYALGAVLSVRPLSGTRNRNYVLETERGTWCLRRRFAGYAEPARVSFDHAANRFLADRGLPIARLLEKTSGATYHVQDGDLWEVYPFVVGTHLREGRLDDVRALGQELARLHGEGESFARRCDKLGPRGEADPRVLLGKSEAIERESPACALPLRRYRTWILDAERRLSDELWTTLPHTLVHGDVQPTNVLLDRGRVVAFVDLDWCAWRPRIYDLAFAVLFCCSSHREPIRADDIWSLTQPANVEQPLARVLLDAYQGDQRALADVEAHALRAQLALTWCHTRISGALKVPSDEREAFLSRGPDDLEGLVSLLGSRVDPGIR